MHREKKPTFITLNSLIIFNIFVVEQHNNKKKKKKNEKYKVYINWLSAKTKRKRNDRELERIVGTNTMFLYSWHEVVKREQMKQIRLF